jgi:hypothetical protein
LEPSIVIPIAIPTLFWEKGIIGGIVGVKIRDDF